MSFRRSLLASTLVVASVGFLAGGGDRGVAALLTDSEAAAATITTAVAFPSTTYRLHNNPTPPVGDTNAQANLPLDTSASTATTLHNYDQDRDAAPGLTIVRGGSGAGETDVAKYQEWRTATILVPQTIDGPVTLSFWSAMKAFGPSTQGSVTAFLQDVDPLTSTSTTIASGTLTVADWQAGSSTWLRRTLTMTASSYLVLTGHRIALRLVVDSAAADDMWFAYDTTSYPSRLGLP